MDPRSSLISRSSDSPRLWADQVVLVGRWMMVLGIIRLACASIDWMTARVASVPNQAGSPVLRSLERLVIDHPPLVLLGPIWLVVLSILVIRTRWPELLRAGAVVFFLLAASGAATFAVDWSVGSNRLLTIGSFDIDRTALALPTPGGVVLALLGTAQLVAELYVACRLVWLLRQPLGPVDSQGVTWFEEMAPRTRSLIGRGCWIATTASLLMVVRLPVLPKVSSMLNASPMLRKLLLMHDGSDSSRARPLVLTSEILARQRLLSRLISEAARAWEEHRYDAASDAYQKVIAIHRSPEFLQDQHSRNSLALLANDFAWLLTTRPDPRSGDPEKAVESAQLALELNPVEGRYWNTLGAAQYRAKNWQEAKNALMRSMELRGDGDGYDWILFALLYAQTGPKSRALVWYDKAARWRMDFGPWEQDLYVFESEAAERLGLPEPPTPSRRPSFHDDYLRRETMGRHRGLPWNPYLEEPRFSRRNRQRSGR